MNKETRKELNGLVEAIGEKVSENFKIDDMEALKKEMFEIMKTIKIN